MADGQRKYTNNTSGMNRFIERTKRMERNRTQQRAIKQWKAQHDV